MRLFLTFSLVFSLISSPVFSKDRNISNVLIKKLEAELIFEQVVLETSYEMTWRPHSSTNLPPDEILEHNLKLYIDNLLNFYKVGNNAWSPSIKNKILKKINWKFAVYLFKKTIAKGHSYYVENGLGACLAFFSGHLLNIVLAFVLPLYDLAYLVPVSIAMPYGEIFAPIYLSTEKASYFLHRRQLFGGKKNYHEFAKYKKKIKKELNILYPKTFLVPLKTDNHVIETVTLREQSLWHRAAKMLKKGLRFLDFETLYQYCVDNNLEMTFANELSNNQDLSSKIKVIILLKHLHENLPMNDFDKLRNTFIEFFNHVTITKGLKELRKWAYLMKNANTISEIKSLTKQLPPEIDLRQIADLWEKIFLPAWANNAHMNRKNFLKLREDFLIMQAEIYSSKHSCCESLKKLIF